MKNIEIIRHKKETYAMIIRKNEQFKKNGVNFFTKTSDLIQVGFINHKKKHFINSHVHIKNRRIINYCTEVLIIKKGKLKVNFYNKKGVSINKQKILFADDIIILFKGGHGFDVLENCKIIEIKQGPYNKKSDKIVFNDKKTNSSKQPPHNHQ